MIKRRPPWLFAACVFIVVALTASVLMLVPGKKGDTRKRAFPSVQRAVGMSIESYYMHVGFYPKSLSDLVSNVCPDWRGPYWEGVVPPRDNYGNPLWYTSPSPESFELRSRGEDGILFTRDDAVTAWKAD